MGLLRSLGLGIVSAVLWTAGPTAQAPGTGGPVSAGTSAIGGRVIDAQTGEPLGNVVVMLGARSAIGSARTTTDATGFYHFANLAENDYTVHVLDPLYLRTCYGATDAARVPCGTVNVIRDQHRAGIDIRLTLAAVIRGRVVDSDGRAVGGATVHASLAPSMPLAGFPSSATTKPDGTFELLNLAGGDTLLSLDMPMTANAPRAPTIFYPGVLAADDAQAIRVAAGIVTSGITFRFPKIANRSLTARISAPAAGATAIKAWLYRTEPRMVRVIALGADDAASVSGLLEGRYFIAVHAQGDSGALVAFEVADLLDDTVELALLLREPGRITGKVVSERGALPPLAGARVAAKWTDDGVEIDPLAADEVEVGPDGSFRIEGLFGTRTVQVNGLSPEWRVQAIRQGRADVSAGVDVASGATVDVTIIVARQ